MKNKIILGLIIFSLVLMPFISAAPTCDPIDQCTSFSDCSIGEVCQSNCCVNPTTTNPGHTCSTVYTGSCGPISAQDSASPSAAVKGVSDYNSASAKAVEGVSIYGIGVYGVGNPYGLYTTTSAYVAGNLRANQYCDLSGNCYSISQLYSGGSSCTSSGTCTDIYSTNTHTNKIIPATSNAPSIELTSTGNIIITLGAGDR